MPSLEVKQNYTYILEQKGHKLNTLEILEIARANKVGKALCNEQWELNISPLLAIARDYNWGWLEYFIPSNR
jgi:hypothetical protein